MTTDFVKGQEVQFVRDSVGDGVNTYPYIFTFKAGHIARVTRVYRDKVTVRSKVDGNYEKSYNVSKSDLALPDPNAPKPRKLGDVPDGMLSPTDPRLAWLWEDAAEVAKLARHCREYDDLCDQLGIPGREREFTVTATLNGIDVSAKIKARSKLEAETALHEKLTQGLAQNASV